jgi:hypothetical protein
MSGSAGVDVLRGWTLKMCDMTQRVAAHRIGIPAVPRQLDHARAALADCPSGADHPTIG